MSGTLSLKTPSGGSVILEAVDTATDKVLTLPAVDSDVVTSAGARVVDGTEGAPSYSFGSSTGTGLYRPAANTLAFSTNGAERVRINSSGNVGIGTTSLDGTGRVRVVQGANQVSFLSEGANTPGYPQFGFAGQTTNNGGRGVGMYLIGDGTLGFSTTATERMRITSAGELLVGTTSTEGKLTVAGFGSSQVGVSSQSPGSYTSQAFWSNSVTAASADWLHFYGTSSSNSVANVLIRGNGNVENANNSYGGFSDIKLKENIVDATPKLHKLCQVRVVNYNLKGDYEQHKQLGVIAQELEKIFPGMVEESPDRDEEGNDLGTTTKSVKYSVFVPMLIKALQELSAKVEALEAKLEEQSDD